MDWVMLDIPALYGPGPTIKRPIPVCSQADSCHQGNKLLSEMHALGRNGTATPELASSDSPNLGTDA
jgi:hypothetical protein